MKVFVIVLLFFAVIGVGFAFVGGKKAATEDDFSEWTIEDEQMVENLDACPKNKMPPGNWTKANMKQWPCRIDLVLTVK